VQRLVVKFTVLIVHFFKKQFVFILGAIEEGPGFQWMTPGMNLFSVWADKFALLNRNILFRILISKIHAKYGQIRKAFTDNGFRIFGPVRPMFPVSHFGTLAAAIFNAIASKAFSGRFRVLF
jgi:hypothetical protein